MTKTINAAGGDYQGLPTTPIKHRGAKKHTGLNWDQVTANYMARGGQVDASVWPKHGKVVVVGGSANSSRANIHTFIENAEYDETASAAPMRVTRPKRKANPGSGRPSKLTPEQRIEIGRRYQAGESLTQLAKAYGVVVTTITNTLAALQIPTRNRVEAGKVTRERNAS
jgi:hypothetical protein